MKKILDIENVLHNLVQKKNWKKSFFHIVKNIQSPLKKKNSSQPWIPDLPSRFWQKFKKFKKLWKKS